MIDIGRMCVKLAGRDAGKKCIIVDILKDHMVLIDGETRRRKCNILHLEPLADVVKIDKGASHEKVANALKALNIEARESKPKAKTERPKAIRVGKESGEALEAKAEKKEKPKKEKKAKETKKKKQETEE